MQVSGGTAFGDDPDIQDRLLFSRAEFFEPEYGGRGHRLGVQLARYIGHSREIPAVASEGDLGDAAIVGIEGDPLEPGAVIAIGDHPADLIGLLQPGELDLGRKFGGRCSRDQPYGLAIPAECSGDVKLDLTALGDKPVQPPCVKPRVVRKPEQRLAVEDLDVELAAVQRKRTPALADQKPFEMAVDQRA